MENCPNCGKLVEKLVRLDNAINSAQYTQLVGVPYPSRDYYCITCARQLLGISDEDLIREERNLSKNPDFIINLLKGRIGQAIIEGVFRNFGYEVYPYGYESYLTNIIKNLRKNWSNSTVRQIRSTPDTLIYDRELNEGYLIEVKSTTLNPENYWIEAKQLKKYKELWGAAVLTIIHTPTLKIYCRIIDQISLDGLTETTPNFAPDSRGYVFNLEKQFIGLSAQFRLINEPELTSFIDRIKNEILNKYGY